MKLPDGKILIHAGAPYDPKKAHEYYLRTRKLKGRKKASSQPASKFDIKNSPMVQDGADPAAAAKFVKGLEGKSDDELRKLSAKLKADDAKATGPSPLGAQAATVDAFLKSRGGAKKHTQVSDLSPQQKREMQAVARARVQKAQKTLNELNKKLKDALAKAKKSERDAKKPKTASEKSKDAREAKKYRESHKTELKTKAKGKREADKASGKDTSSNSVEGLKKQIATAEKALATAKAKQKALA